MEEGLNHIKITAEPLDIAAISDLATSPCTGATSLFVGTTRDNFEGKTVVQLEYEAYVPMAEKELQKLCARARSKWPDLHAIALHHRLGLVAATQASVVVAVSSPHRGASLDAVHFLIDELKATVPIWKKEVYADGSVWKANKECAWNNDGQVLRHADVDLSEDVVQITASKEEMDRRMEAFMARKREEINAANVLEFTNKHHAEEKEHSCARTDSVLQKRKDSLSHLRQSQVVNQYGPQTVTSLKDLDPMQHSMSKKVKLEDDATSSDVSSLPDGIQERINSLEGQLALVPGRPMPKDIYSRLKQVEDRVRFLEGVSQEYFNATPSGLKKEEESDSAPSSFSQEERSEAISDSLTGINSRIQELQASLRASKSAGEVAARKTSLTEGK